MGSDITIQDLKRRQDFLVLVQAIVTTRMTSDNLRIMRIAIAVPIEELPQCSNDLLTYAQEFVTEIIP